MSLRDQIPLKQTGNDANARVRPVEIDMIVEAIDANTNAVKNLPVGSMGLAKADTNPGIPTGNVRWEATQGVTYQYFLDENGEAIEIPDEEDDKVVTSPYMVWNGSYWEANWSLTPKPNMVDYVPNSAKGTEIATLVDGKVPENQAPFTSSGNNKLDVSKVESGRFASDTGAPVASNNWCRISDFPCAGGQKISLVGTGTPAISNNIFFFKNEVSEILSMQTGPTGTAPANTVSVDITLLNVVGVGLDPNNPSFYANVMLNYGDPLPFEPFKLSLDANKVSGTPAAAQAQIDAITRNVNLLLAKYNIFYRFNGIDSAINLPSTYLLKEDGDYIEFKAKWNGSLYTQGLGFMGRLTTPNSNVLGFYSGTQLWLRELIPSGGSAPAYKEFNNLPSLNQWRTIRIDILDGYYVLKVDGAIKGSNPVENGINISHIGNAYSTNAKFDIEYLKIKVAETPLLEITDFVNTAGSANVEMVVEPKSADTGDVIPEMFFSYSASGNGEFKVYTKMPNSTNLFIGFTIKHIVDMSDLVYVNVWRVYEALVFRYSDGAMNQLAYRALVTGENECVYRTPGKIDFTGGYHGDETLIDVQFLVNGENVPLEKDITLTQCSSFRYIQNSNTHRTASGTSENPVIDPNHTIESVHRKETVIQNGGYDTLNKLTWQDSITIALWYHGISCVGKDFGEFVRNEFGESAVISGDALEKLRHDGARMYFAENISNGLKASVSSILKQPLNDDPLCQMFIWDRPDADNKYYRKTPDNIDVSNEVVWESNMSVRFDCL